MCGDGCLELSRKPELAERPSLAECPEVILAVTANIVLAPDGGDQSGDNPCMDACPDRTDECPGECLRPDCEGGNSSVFDCVRIFGRKA